MGYCEILNSVLSCCLVLKHVLQYKWTSNYRQVDDIVDNELLGTEKTRDQQ